LGGTPGAIVLVGMAATLERTFANITE
jgi:hypothetical protein